MSRKFAFIFAIMFVLLVLPAMTFAAEDDPVVIYFFPGGSPGGTFATVVYNGAVHAADILGDRVEMHYLWSNWSPQTMVTQLEQAIAANPDGIAIMGHPGDEAYMPFVEDAEAKGIIVTSQNATLPELQAEFASKGFGYVGQGLYSSGWMLGTGVVNKAGLKEGDRALVWGLRSQPTRGQRTQGAIDALEDAGVIVDYIDISPEVDKDAANGIPIIVGYLQANPDCKAVITDHGNLTSAQGTYFEAAGFGPDEIYGAGFDLSAATVESIKSGYTDLVLDQQPFLQGFLPVMQIYLTKKFGFSGLDIDTGGGLISSENIDFVAPLAEQGIR
ncbi:MAG: simple sugar transport system substrate-binding protein [Kosmotogales bacterium]|nr:simple sugar transport system substrate-binding protein [Kosmotogales bacterium]